jgi:hypothetical protein
MTSAFSSQPQKLNSCAFSSPVVYSQACCNSLILSLKSSNLSCPTRTQPPRQAKRQVKIPQQTHYQNNQPTEIFPISSENGINQFTIHESCSFSISKIKNEDASIAQETYDQGITNLNQEVHWLNKNEDSIIGDSGNLKKRKRKPKTFRSLPWDNKSDNMLKKMVQDYKKDWKKISIYMTNRLFKVTPHALKNRFRVLEGDKYLSRVIFTSREDHLIECLFLQHGPNWVEISKKFDNRTPLMVKNRYYSYVRKRKIDVKAH